MKTNKKELLNRFNKFIDPHIYCSEYYDTSTHTDNEIDKNSSASYSYPTHRVSIGEAFNRTERRLLKKWGKIKNI